MAFAKILLPGASCPDRSGDTTPLRLNSGPASHKPRHRTGSASRVDTMPLRLFSGSGVAQNIRVGYVCDRRRSAEILGLTSSGFTVAAVIARCQTAKLAPNRVRNWVPSGRLATVATRGRHRDYRSAPSRLPTSNSNNFLHAAFFRCANSPFIGEYRRNSVEGSLLGDEEG